jgi:antitoxin YefM
VAKFVDAGINLRLAPTLGSTGWTPGHGTTRQLTKPDRGAATLWIACLRADRSGVVTQLVTRRSVRPRPHHCGRGLICEPLRESNPGPAHYEQTATHPLRPLPATTLSDLTLWVHQRHRETWVRTTFDSTGASTTSVGSSVWRLTSPVRRPCGTIVAMTVEPLRTVRDHLSDFVDRAEREHERVVVTRNGRPAAVLIGYEDLAAIEETLEILSDGEAMTDIREAHKEVARGEVIEGVDAVRALRSRR